MLSLGKATLLAESIKQLIFLFTPSEGWAIAVTIKNRSTCWNILNLEYTTSKTPKLKKQNKNTNPSKIHIVSLSHLKVLLLNLGSQVERRLKVTIKFFSLKECRFGHKKFLPIKRIKILLENPLRLKWNQTAFTLKAIAITISFIQNTLTFDFQLRVKVKSSQPVQALVRAQWQTGNRFQVK